MSLAADITTELAYLTRELKADPCVAHALALRAAWALGNYHRFFRLYAHAPCMSGYLVDKFADRERKAALKAMIKTYVKLISALALRPSAPQRPQAPPRPPCLLPHLCAPPSSGPAPSAQPSPALLPHRPLVQAPFLGGLPPPPPSAPVGSGTGPRTLVRAKMSVGPGVTGKQGLTAPKEGALCPG